MSTTLIGTVAGLLIAICWGSSDYLSAKGTAKLNAFQVNFAMQAVSLILVAGLFLVSGYHIGNAHELIRIAISSLLISTAFVIFVKALSFGDLGVVVPLSSIFPLFTIILFYIFLNISFKPSQVAAMVGIVLGSAILAYKKNHKKLPLRELHSQTFLALIAAIIWGMAFFIVDPVVSRVPWQTITITSELVALVFAVILIWATERKRIIESITRSLTVRSVLIAGLMGEVGMFIFYLGSGKAGNVVIPTVLSAGGGPVVTSLWAAAIDKEKLGVTKRIGALIVVLGVVILNAT